jgi:hypothetical protein
MKLFDEFDRINCNYSEYSEPKFTFINNSARAGFDEIRCVLEKWFTHYPISGQADLRSRFRSKINSHHQAAFFELFLHELLLKLNCKIELHPDIPDKLKTPDFLVETLKGERFYLEATLVTNESEAETAAQARMNSVYDILNREVDSTNFSLAISIKGSPKTPPPAKNLSKFVNERLSELNPDEIIELYYSNRKTEIPFWKFEYDGWKIEIRPIPKKSEARGKLGKRPIVMQSTVFRWMDHRTSIKNSIIKKAKKYGDLNLPYIIAVNILDFIDEIDIEEALFGKEQFVVDSNNIESNKPSVARIEYYPDGVWRGPTGPRYTRVSAVLFAKRLFAWSVPSTDLLLFHNPWAKKSINPELIKLPQTFISENQVKFIKGESIKKILNLPESWPKCI